MKKSGNDLTRIELLYADESIIAVHKAPGIACQSNSQSPEEALDRSLIKYLNEPVRLCTRIDQPVSGIVLFYRKAYKNKKPEWKIREKTYLAIVEGHPGENKTIVSHISRDGRKKKAVEDVLNGKKAELSYTILREWDRYSLLQIQPTTGRFHQIRLQLAQIGFPVKGDVKYGARRKNHDRSIHLHAMEYVLENNNQHSVHIVDYSFPDEVLWNLTRAYIKNINAIP